MPPRVMTQSASRPATTPQGRGTGGRAGRGGGRNGGQSGDQGDGRNEGQGGQVGGRAQVGDQGRGQGNGRNQNGDAVNDNIRGDVSMGCTYKEFLACNPKEYDGKGDSILLVKLKDIDSMSNMYTICRNEGFSDLNIHHVGGFGKFFFFEKEDSSALSSGRVCISSKSHRLISKNVQVEINNELFEATVQEIGSWCIKITDDYIDLSSNDNIKDVDTSSESIDDHSVDDLEYIQTNLNNIVNQVSEQKMDNNEENKQGEEDIHLIVPQQPPKEEANNKESNPECKAESSDLSRPPGFEFMKKSSSPSSKCSTSFARFRKKDIKGVSLIHELNQIIDVGNSLGYDVRVVERGKEENACGSKIFALNTIMARGRSGGLISMWDPNFFSKESIWCDDSFIIIKGNWKNVVGDCYMVNIYGPQDQVSKLALWNRLQDFMHHHNGSYIMFGDMNAVRNEQERVGSIFNNIEADYFNYFIDATGLVDLPIGGRCFTWMNKANTKLSKLDRFLISEDVIDLLPDIRITALDRIWSDHNPILLHVDKIDFGPSPFKLYNSWLLRDGFDDLIKSEWDSLDSNNSGFPIKCHEKFCILKAKIRQWNNNNKTMKRNKKAAALEELSSIEKKIDKGSASPSDTENRLNLLYELEIIDKFASIYLIQKARVKWDIEGDENTKFFHGLINQKRRNQMINGIMVEGNWITDPSLIKDAFFQFYKVKFQAQNSQVSFPNLPHSQTLNSMDQDYLESLVTHEEIKEAVWDCGSSKAPGPDGFSFAFVKKILGHH
ncbi:RNA-directed DNA polymerase, eukaryota, reverse transcriptase zinc-binding domain protein [Tanacetum coccineum]